MCTTRPSATDDRNFTGLDAAIVRANHRRVNEALTDVATGQGAVIDLHSHFPRRRSDLAHRRHRAEPSPARPEIRRCFLPAVLAALDVLA